MLLRLKVTMNVNMFWVHQLPVPRASKVSPRLGDIFLRAARLTCTTSEFADLWDDVAQCYPDSVLAPWRPERAATDPRQRAQLRAEIDALVADLYGLPEADFAYILTTFPLLDRDQPALPGESKSSITRDLALLELFKLHGIAPPQDVVAFFAAAGAEIGGITGPVRDLAERMRLAREVGAVAYVPSGRGGGEKLSDDEEEPEREPVGED